ncbi:MAG: ATP-binding protein [Paludibacteraceae bacterium]|nr:ATP-binding protein [Paludibacteraceae bacterium]
MKTILLSQRKERDDLLAQNYIARHTAVNTNDLLQSHLIKLITGPRRVGKSTQALLMLRDKNFAYLNFDKQELRDNWNADLVMRLLDEIYPNYDYLLLDEVQNLPHWDVWVTELFRRGKNLVITGSNANMLSSEMATVLTGKYLPLEMLPFSLAEFFEWHHMNLNDILPEQQNEAIVLAEDYLRNGGYPETIAARSLAATYLSTLFDSIIWKDIVRRHKIRNTEAINNMALYLLSNFCNPLSANDITDALNLKSVNTTQKFMGYLHEPFLFYYLPRFNNKLKLMKNAPKKIYVVDNGFVTAKAFSTSDNFGRLQENQVFVNLLRKGYNTEQSMFYYRTRNDKEIDFVLREHNHVKQLVQVSYEMSAEKTIRRECSALVEAADELHCEELYVLTYNEKRMLEWNGRTIQIIPAAEWFRA